MQMLTVTDVAYTDYKRLSGVIQPNELLFTVDGAQPIKFTGLVADASDPYVLSGHESSARTQHHPMIRYFYYQIEEVRIDICNLDFHSVLTVSCSLELWERAFQAVLAAKLPG